MDGLPGRLFGSGDIWPEAQCRKIIAISPGPGFDQGLVGFQASASEAGWRYRRHD